MKSRPEKCDSVRSGAGAHAPLFLVVAGTPVGVEAARQTPNTEKQAHLLTAATFPYIMKPLFLVLLPGV